MADLYRALTHTSEWSGFIRLVCQNGWKTNCVFITANEVGVIVRMKQGQQRFYPWTEVRHLAWGGPSGESESEEDREQ